MEIPYALQCKELLVIITKLRASPAPSLLSQPIKRCTALLETGTNPLLFRQMLTMNVA